MAAPKKHTTPHVSSFSIDRAFLDKVKLFALKESVRLGKKVSVSELINMSLKAYMKTGAK